MVERLIDQETAENYWKPGGILNRDSFEKARGVQSVLAKEGIPWWVRNSSLVQVESMARFSKVPITTEQEYLYAFLREITGETEGEFDSLPETPGTVPVWVLNDQRLMAEVIRLTDKTNLDSFMRAYPNIFKMTE